MTVGDRNKLVSYVGHLTHNPRYVHRYVHVIMHPDEEHCYTLAFYNYEFQQRITNLSEYDLREIKNQIEKMLNHKIT